MSLSDIQHVAYSLRVCCLDRSQVPKFKGMYLHV